jgi:hypothetical protein
MSASESFLVGLLIFIAVICFGALGFIDGKKAGAKEACQSVKLEWVADKCMKVTREVV